MSVSRIKTFKGWLAAITGQKEAKRKSVSRAIRAEQLESRELFAVGIGFVQPQLGGNFRMIVTSDDASDKVEIKVNQGQLQNQAWDDELEIIANGQTVAYEKLFRGSSYGGTPLFINAIEFRGNGGNDTFSVIGNKLPVIGDGPMSITAYGGAGDDRLEGANGADALMGGTGNDVLIGHEASDRLAGNEDQDLLFGDEILTESEQVAGYKAGHDTLAGGEGNDQLYGGRGNDVLWGGLGNDRMSGGLGDDDLYGEGGHDTLYGDEGKDILKGDAGDDRLYGGDGNDRAEGASGNDQIFGGKGDDTLDGGTGNDSMWGDLGNDVLYGGDGSDMMYGGDGADLMLGDNGNDFMYGLAGDDMLLGGNGNDTLRGGDGNDDLSGEAGYDVIYGDLGNDELDGGTDGIADFLVGGLGKDKFHTELYGLGDKFENRDKPYDFQAAEGDLFV